MVTISRSSSADLNPRVAQVVAELAQVIIWRAAPNGRPLEECRWPTGSHSQNLGEEWIEALHPDDQVPVRALWREAFAAGRPFRTEYRLKQQDRPYRWMRGQGMPLMDGTGQIYEWVGTVSDIQNEVEARSELAASEQRLRLALETGGFGVWDHDLITGQISGIEMDGDLFGQEGENLDLPSFLRMVHPDDQNYIQERIAEQTYLGSHATSRCEFRIIQPETFQVKWISATGTVLKDKNGTPARSVGLYREITAERLELERLQYEATHDPLTGLPNWRALTEHIEVQRRLGRGLSLVLLRPVGIHQATGILGLEASSSLLKQLADRLVPALPGLLVGRSEAGFVVLTEVRAEDELQSITETIRNALAASFDVGSSRVALAGYLGLARLPEDASEPTDLLLAADLAIDRNRSAAGADVSRFSNAMHEEALREQQLAADLRRAASSGEFVLYYQPQVELAGSRVVGVEALIRWNNPEVGLISPGEFLPILKKSPAARRVGEWVIATAVRDMAQLNAERFPLPPLRVAVNLFSEQFRSQGLASKIEDILRSHNFPPDLFEVEVTEKVILNSKDWHVLHNLEDIRQLGCPVAFDDFGTGYASLSMLRNFPITRLKIDREFVQNLERSPADAAIVDAILSLGRSLRLAVTAEGVETEQQLEILRAHGCQDYQGYLFGKPMPFEELLELLRT